MNSSLFDNIAPQLDNHIQDVDRMMSLLSMFHEAKEQQYQRSFAKRGEVGVWYNLARQLDRMDGVAKKALTEGEYSAGLVDTLCDITIYAVKWLAVIHRLRPEDFQKWLKETYCPYMGVEYDEVLEWFMALNQHNHDATDAIASSLWSDWASGPDESMTGVIVRHADERDDLASAESDDERFADI